MLCYSERKIDFPKIFPRFPRSTHKKLQNMKPFFIYTQRLRIPQRENADQSTASSSPIGSMKFSQRREGYRKLLLEELLIWNAKHPTWPRIHRTSYRNYPDWCLAV
jgi:hypothetical protein